MMMTIGTHNLLDGAGRVTPFADVIMFTEAPFTPLDLPGHTVARCRRQRDLVIAYRPSVFTATRLRYRLAHPGVAGVTPNRGTFAVEGVSVTGRPVVLVGEHRVNAAFPPYKRGEAVFRRAVWSLHTRMTLRMIRGYKRRGFVVVAGGDLNTPPQVDGYRGVLDEGGLGLDRLGTTRRLRAVTVGGSGGSDHRRLRAVLDLP